MPASSLVLLIAGGRNLKPCVQWLDRQVKRLIESLVAKGHIQPNALVTIVSGTARGADKMGEAVAALNGWAVRPFPANWKPQGRHGPTDRAAGHKRNRKMALHLESERLGGAYSYGLLLWDGQSRGTAGMYDLLQAYELPHFSHVLPANCFAKYTPKGW